MSFGFSALRKREQTAVDAITKMAPKKKTKAETLSPALRKLVRAEIRAERQADKSTDVSENTSDSSASKKSSTKKKKQTKISKRKEKTHKKKDKKHGGRHESDTSSRSSSSKSKKSTSSSDVADYEVDAWQPERWADETGQLQRFETVRSRLSKRGQALKGELDTLQDLVAAGAKSQNEKIKKIVGKRIVILLAKQEAATNKFLECEDWLRSKMDKPSKWGKVKAAALVKFRGSGRSDQRGRGNFRGRGDARGGGGARGNNPAAAKH